MPLRGFAINRALVVGISDYPRLKQKDASWSQIHGANDALMIKKTLKQQGFQVATLINKDATAANIRKALDRLQSQATRGDIVYIHFSCHGQPVEDMNGDEADGWDEAIVAYDAWKIAVKGIYEGKCHIVDDELNKRFISLRKKIGTAGFVYVVVDACHSGSIDRGEENDEMEFVRGTKLGFSISHKKYMPRIDARPNIPIKSEKGMADICMLEACRSYQSNYEFKQNGTYYGPLSFYVNQVLNHHKLSADDRWIREVKKLMDNNPMLVRQNMVIQTTRQ